MTTTPSETMWVVRLPLLDTLTKGYLHSRSLMGAWSQPPRSAFFHCLNASTVQIMLAPVENGDLLEEYLDGSARRLRWNVLSHLPFCRVLRRFFHPAHFASLKVTVPEPLLCTLSAAPPLGDTSSLRLHSKCAAGRALQPWRFDY